MEVIIVKEEQYVKEGRRRVVRIVKWLEGFEEDRRVSFLQHSWGGRKARARATQTNNFRSIYLPTGSPATKCGWDNVRQRKRQSNGQIPKWVPLHPSTCSIATVFVTPRAEFSFSSEFLDPNLER